MADSADEARVHVRSQSIEIRGNEKPAQHLRMRCKGNELSPILVSGESVVWREICGLKTGAVLVLHVHGYGFTCDMCMHIMRG